MVETALDLESGSLSTEGRETKPRIERRAGRSAADTSARSQRSSCGSLKWSGRIANLIFQQCALPVTTAILPANSVMCTSLAFWRRSKYGPPRLPLRRWGRAVWGQCQVGKASRPRARTAHVGALGRPADQFIDLIGVWPDQNAPLVGGAVGSTKPAAAMRARTAQGRDRLPSCPHPVWSSIQFATGCRSDRGSRRFCHTPVR